MVGSICPPMPKPVVGVQVQYFCSSMDAVLPRGGEINGGGFCGLRSQEIIRKFECWHLEISRRNIPRRRDIRKRYPPF